MKTTHAYYFLLALAAILALLSLLGVTSRVNLLAVSVLALCGAVLVGR